jgi:hypothetical protein
MNDGSSQQNLPDWMTILWCASAPFSLMLAVRILWEKTVWTWTRGPQMVGFSLWHIHPFFAVFGMLSFWAVIVWSIIAVLFVAVRRRHFTAIEVAMLLCAAFVLCAMLIPDRFFAR